MHAGLWAIWVARRGHIRGVAGPALYTAGTRSFGYHNSWSRFSLRKSSNRAPSASGRNSRRHHLRCPCSPCGLRSWRPGIARLASRRAATSRSRAAMANALERPLALSNLRRLDKVSSWPAPYYYQRRSGRRRYTRGRRWRRAPDKQREGEGLVAGCGCACGWCGCGCG